MLRRQSFPTAATAHSSEVKVTRLMNARLRGMGLRCEIEGVRAMRIKVAP